jgi:hypothetical protein
VVGAGAVTSLVVGCITGVSVGCGWFICGSTRFGTLGVVTPQVFCLSSEDNACSCIVLNVCPLAFFAASWD